MRQLTLRPLITVCHLIQPQCLPLVTFVDASIALSSLRDIPDSPFWYASLFRGNISIRSQIKHTFWLVALRKTCKWHVQPFQQRDFKLFQFYFYSFAHCLLLFVGDAGSLIICECIFCADPELMGPIDWSPSYAINYIVIENHTYETNEKKWETIDAHTDVSSWFQFCGRFDSNAMEPKAKAKRCDEKEKRQS